MDDHKIINESMSLVANYIKSLSSNLPENTSNFIDDIEKTRNQRIFLLGAGRSGFEARAFAMRLMHLGFNARVICEFTTPIPTKDDLVIIISGSGNTRSVVNIVKNITRTKIITITTKSNSELGKASDMVITIPIDFDNKEIQKISPMGTIFEAIMHVYLDAIIAELKIRLNASEESMKDRHLLSEYVGIV